ncbi:MAG: hypothetical protein HY718_08555 [Planctomycetes bacterium]|nr:hypothetical protein [Planctomycetota bacterium]
MLRTIGLTTGVLVIMVAVLPAHGQYYVQQGNVLDANNRLGSGGINSPSQAYRINQGNRLISGNTTGGTAFRSYSPIRDASSLFLGTPNYAPGIGLGGLYPGLSGVTTGSFGGAVLPSDRLNTFRRDSYNLADARRWEADARRWQTAAGFAPSPYYSPTSTVTNSGQIIRGLNQPGTSQVRSSYSLLRNDYSTQVENPLDAARTGSLLGNPLSAEPRLMRADTGKTVSGNVNERLLGSPLFSGIRQVPLSQLAAEADRQVEGAPAAGWMPERTPRGAESGAGSPTANLAGSAVDRLTGGAGLPAAAGPEARLSRPVGASPGGAARAEADSALARPLAGAGSPSGTLQIPSGPQETTTAGPALRRAPLREVPVDQGPLSTFVGTQDERLKTQLASAEELLRQQRYYDAARRYDMAHAVQLDNPLPLFGRAMALLAAGDYMASANDLFMAIQLAGPQTAVQVNLRQFIPDLTVLDQRRAFLENRLEAVDDFRLRFLLGWADYMSGLTADGLANMQKAAAAAPEPMTALRRFVEHVGTQPSGHTAPPASRPGE